jgi:hypothetical protein
MAGSISKVQGSLIFFTGSGNRISAALDSLIFKIGFPEGQFTVSKQSAQYSTLVTQFASFLHFPDCDFILAMPSTFDATPIRLPTWTLASSERGWDLIVTEEQDLSVSINNVEYPPPGKRLLVNGDFIRFFLDGGINDQLVRAGE